MRVRPSLKYIQVRNTYIFTHTKVTEALESQGIRQPSRLRPGPRA